MHLFRRWLSPTLLGLDIQATAIYLTELRCRKNSYYLENYSYTPYPTAQNIPQTLQAFKPRSKHVAIALASGDIISKTLQVDKHWDDQTIADHIEVSAADYLPYTRDELYFDFHRQGNTTDNKTQQDVLLVACRQETITQQITLLKTAKLKVKIVDTVPYALERAYKLLIAPIHSAPLIGLLYISCTSLLLMILKNDQLIYQREENFITTSLNNLVILAMVKRLLHYFFTTQPYSALDKILLAGIGALMADIAETLHTDTGFTTIVINPFTNITIADHLNTTILHQQAPAFLLSCGLALRANDVNNY